MLPLPALKPLRKTQQISKLQNAYSLNHNDINSSNNSNINNALNDNIKYLVANMIDLIKEVKKSNQQQQYNRNSREMIKEGQAVSSVLQGRSADDEIKNKKQYRFCSINYQIPEKLPQNRIQRQQQIMIWVGNMLKQTLSIAFNLFKSSQLQSNKLNSYCSQNILRNLITFSKKHSLSSSELSKIDKQLCNNLLPYFLIKYPQSQQSEINNRFSSLLIERDLIDDNQYDFVYKSGVKFDYDQSQNYNSQIMKFINYMLSLPDTITHIIKKDQNNLINKQQTNKIQMISQTNIQNIIETTTHNAIQNSQKTTIRKAFFTQMQQFFKMVEDQDNVIGMNKYDPKSSDTNLLLLAFDKNSSKKTQSQRQQYREKVKHYTGYLIGQKLSEGTKKFSEYQINSGDLKLKSSALMRVVTKWSQQLQKCFDENEILNRQSPFRMKNGQQKFIQKYKIVYLNRLLQQQKVQIDKKMKDIIRNNFEHQSNQMKLQTNKQLLKFTKEEAIVGQFTSTIFKNNLKYLVNYLNLLIHGINKAANYYQDFQCCMVQKYITLATAQSLHDSQISENQKKKTFLDMFDKVKSAINKVRKSIPSQVPQLITFRIGDLLRCKCSSKQNQIVALYKLIQRRNQMNPNQIKILRVKNRLNKGNKDILMNILYRNTMIVEMQLAIKQDKSKFIECSNKFNHYLYELKRAKFGAITEMCSIWMSQDLRSKFYQQKLQNINKRKKLKQNQITALIQNFKNCCQKNFNITNLPFECSRCHFLYSQYGLNEKHIQCQKCHNFTCFICQLQSGKQTQKLKLLPQFKQNEYFDQNNLIFIQHFTQKGGLILNLNSKQKKVIPFFTACYRKNYYFFQYIKSSQKVKIIQQFKQKKLPDQFLKQNIMCTSKKIKQNLFKNNPQVFNLIKKYFIQTNLKQNMKLQKISLSMIYQNLSLQMLSIESQQARPQIKKLNLSQNERLINIQPFIGKFPNVELAVLNKITLTQVPKNIWKNVTHLYLNNNKIVNMDNICSCTNLIELDLSNNKIQTVPTQIGNLNKLQKFRINNNNIISISDDISYLKQLKNLNISFNKKLQTLPQKICQLNKLQVFEMQSLQSLQKLPQEFGNFILLKNLQFHEMLKLKKLPQSICKLVNLQNIQIRSNKQIQQFNIRFNHIKQIKRISISQASKLKKIIFQKQQLQNLKQLIIQRNPMLQQIPQAMQNLKQMQQLKISTNDYLTEFPKNFGNFQNLKKLDLLDGNPSKLNQSQGKFLKQLPQSFGNMTSLTELFIKWFKKLKKLPQSLGNLKSLQKLQLSDLNDLVQLPKSMKNLKNLQILTVKNCGNSLFTISDCMRQLSSLKQLSIQDTKCQEIPQQFFNLLTIKSLRMFKISIKNLPQTFGTMKSLQKLSLSSSTNLKQLPKSFINLKSLKNIYLGYNECLVLSQQFVNIQNLQAFKSVYNSCMKLPNNFGKLKNLKKFQPVNEHWFQNNMPESIGQLESLQELIIFNSSKLYTMPQSFGRLQNLKHFQFSDNNNFVQFPQSFGSLKSLQKFVIYQCRQLTKLPQSLGNLSNLKHLKIQSLDIVDHIPSSLGNLKSLQFLSINSMFSIIQLPQSIGNLSQLQQLHIYFNHRLIDLPYSILNLKKLRKLQIRDNTYLKSTQVTKMLSQLPLLQQFKTSIKEEDIDSAVMHLVVGI